MTATVSAAAGRAPADRPGRARPADSSSSRTWAAVIGLPVHLRDRSRAQLQRPQRRQHGEVRGDRRPGGVPRAQDRSAAIALRSCPSGRSSPSALAIRAQRSTVSTIAAASGAVVGGARPPPSRPRSTAPARPPCVRPACRLRSAAAASRASSSLRVSRAQPLHRQLAVATGSTAASTAATIAGSVSAGRPAQFGRERPGPRVVDAPLGQRPPGGRQGRDQRLRRLGQQRSPASASS